MENQTKELTGYPSIDKPWLKYYKASAESEANQKIQNKTIWDVIEERLYEHMDIPAIEYFGRSISRKDFIENVYLWAKIFKKLSVRENEIVAYYGPFMPDVGYMFFALNILGACPYFLKLAISPNALAEETKECRIAIVFDQMWGNVREEFENDRFERVIIVKVTDSMPTPKKQIVSSLSRMKSNVRIPDGEKYISIKDAKKLIDGNSKVSKVPYAPYRNAAITSSSGTTGGGIVKGVIATNEAMISMINLEVASGLDKLTEIGDKVLNHFPPTAATSLFSLFLMPLYCGETIIMDPRVSEKDFFNQVIYLKPNLVLTTGSSWDAFFNMIEKSGKYNLNYAKQWIVGGEGADVKRFKKWRAVIQKNGGKTIYSGYGQSEHFSTVSVEPPNVIKYGKTKMSVGIPLAGTTIGVFDDAGNELGYNKRGELWIKSNAVTRGYYNKPLLTAQTIVDGWLHTGDLAEIDNDGFIYIWGRLKDTISLKDGREIYLFDIEEIIKGQDYIDDVIVIEKPIDKNIVNLVAHIVWNENVSNDMKVSYLQEISERIKKIEPGVRLCTYAIHDGMLPYSPTTLKKDRNKMMNQKEGYIQIFEHKMKNIYYDDLGNGIYREKEL